VRDRPLHTDVMGSRTTPSSRGRVECASFPMHLGVIGTGFRARYEVRMGSLLLGFATFRLMKYSPDGKSLPRDFSL
jgi:hypothetical protein